MKSLMKIQLVLLGSLCWLVAYTVCFEAVPFDVSQRTLTVTCTGSDSCQKPLDKHGKCVNGYCVCHEKYFPSSDFKTCTDMPDAKTLAELRRNRTLATQCPTGQQSGSCPKNSACIDSRCLCDDGFIHTADQLSCIAGARMAATITLVPVFMSTIIYLFYKFN